MPYLKTATKYLQHNPLCFIDCLTTISINNFIDALYLHPNSKTLKEEKVIQYWSLNHREKLKRKRSNNILQLIQFFIDPIIMTRFYSKSSFLIIF